MLPLHRGFIKTCVHGLFEDLGTLGHAGKIYGWTLQVFKTRTYSNHLVNLSMNLLTVYVVKWIPDFWEWEGRKWEQWEQKGKLQYFVFRISNLELNLWLEEIWVNIEWNRHMKASFHGSSEKVSRSALSGLSQGQAGWGMWLLNELPTLSSVNSKEGFHRKMQTLLSFSLAWASKILDFHV